MNTNSFVNIDNNTAPFVSITWHQKKPWVVLYTRCSLPCNYVTKTIGILQRVKILCLSSQKKLWLNFQGNWKSDYLKKIQSSYWYAVFKKKCLLCPSEEISPYLKLHMETFSYLVWWVYFLTLTFYQKLKQETKNWSINAEAVGWCCYS